VHLDLASTLMRQRAVAARIGVDLDAIQHHRPQPQRAHLARHHLHLHEQRLDLFEEAPAEPGDRVVIRVLVGSDEAEGDRIRGRLPQFAAGKHAGGIAVDEQPSRTAE
jgi:hypothetical protein